MSKLEDSVHSPTNQKPQHNNDRLVENMKDLIVELKNEQVTTQQQLFNLSQDMSGIDKKLKNLGRDGPANINIAFQTTNLSK